MRDGGSMLTVSEMVDLNFALFYALHEHLEESDCEDALHTQEGTMIAAQALRAIAIPQSMPGSTRARMGKSSTMVYPKVVNKFAGKRLVPSSPGTSSNCGVPQAAPCGVVTTAPASSSAGPSASVSATLRTVPGNVPGTQGLLFAAGAPTNSSSNAVPTSTSNPHAQVNALLSGSLASSSGAHAQPFAGAADPVDSSMATMVEMMRSNQATQEVLLQMLAGREGSPRKKKRPNDDLADDEDDNGEGSGF